MAKWLRMAPAWATEDPAFGLSWPLAAPAAPFWAVQGLGPRGHGLVEGSKSDPNKIYFSIFRCGSSESKIKNAASLAHFRCWSPLWDSLSKAKD